MNIFILTTANCNVMMLFPWTMGIFSSRLLTKINHQTYLGHKGPNFFSKYIKTYFSPKLVLDKFWNFFGSQNKLSVTIRLNNPLKKNNITARMIKILIIYGCVKHPIQKHKKNPNQCLKFTILSVFLN